MIAGIQVNLNGIEWKLPQLLYLVDAVVLAESKEKLNEMVGHLDDMCRWK